MPNEKTNPTQREMLRKKGYITVAEASKRTGISPATLYALLDEEKLAGVSVGSGKYARRYVSAKALVEHVGPDAAKLLGLV